MTMAKGSICTTSVGILIARHLQRRRQRQADAEEGGAQQHPDRAAAGQHGEHDADEARAAGHEGDEEPGAHIGHIGAADPGQEAGRQHRERAGPR